MVIILFILELIVLRSYYNSLRRDEPDRYFALKELHGKSSIAMFAKYIFFRFFPIFSLCLINYVLITSPLNLFSIKISVLLFNTLLIITELLFTNIRSIFRYYGLGLSYLHVTITILILPVGKLADLFFVHYKFLLPSIGGIIDNIWSAIIIYGLLSFFNVFSNKKDIEGDSSFYSFRKEDLLSKIKNFEKLIENESKKHSANIELVKAIAIYESIQRPKIIRILESILVSIVKRPISQGVMQYTINKRITDEESIILAIENKFKNSQSDEGPYFLNIDLISNYNPSERYINDVRTIYFILLQ